MANICGDTECGRRNAGNKEVGKMRRLGKSKNEGWGDWEGRIGKAEGGIKRGVGEGETWG